jgi:hypothetical protein
MYADKQERRTALLLSRPVWSGAALLCIPRCRCSLAPLTVRHRLSQLFLGRRKLLLELLDLLLGRRRLCLGRFGFRRMLGRSGCCLTCCRTVVIHVLIVSSAAAALLGHLATQLPAFGFQAGKFGLLLLMLLLQAMFCGHCFSTGRRGCLEVLLGCLKFGFGLLQVIFHTFELGIGRAELVVLGPGLCQM